MRWTDEMVAEEVARQQQSAKEKEALDAVVSEYYPEQREWAFVEYTPGGHDYAWVHRCGSEYYQLDCPEDCYRGCEE